MFIYYYKKGINHQCQRAIYVQETELVLKLSEDNDKSTAATCEFDLGVQSLYFLTRTATNKTVKIDHIEVKG